MPIRVTTNGSVGNAPPGRTSIGVHGDHAAHLEHGLGRVADLDGMRPPCNEHID